MWHSRGMLVLPQAVQSCCQAAYASVFGAYVQLLVHWTSLVVVTTTSLKLQLLSHGMAILGLWCHRDVYGSHSC